jgi:hypothetical protein
MLLAVNNLIKRLLPANRMIFKGGGGGNAAISGSGHF